MNPVVHFQIPAENRDRISAFYSKAFGWQIHMLGPDYGEYVLAATTDSEETPNGPGRPKEPGAINGGFYLKTDDPLSQNTSIVVAVDDINESMGKVKSAGGQISGDVQEIPGVGLYAAALDTEGNLVGMLQPSKEGM